MTPREAPDLQIDKAVEQGPGRGSTLGSIPVLIYGLAIFSSAFLLFEVQPLIAKIMLPWFGGAAAVWIICLLFFQVALLLGYLYAHLLTQKLSVHRLRVRSMPPYSSRAFFSCRFCRTVPGSQPPPKTRSSRFLRSSESP